MDTVASKSKSKAPVPKKLTRLKKRLQAHRITQFQIADRYGCTHFHVNNVLGGRVVSAPVVRIAQEMLAERLAAKRAAAPLPLA